MKNMLKKGEKPYYIPDNLNRVVFENRIYRLNFIGWDKKIDVINQDTIYTATYDKTEMDIFVDGDNYYFGYYPQSLEENQTIIDTLNEKAGTLPTSTNNYDWINYYDFYTGFSSETYPTTMWYIDIDIDEDGLLDYRGVYFTEYRRISYDTSSQSSNQKTNGLELEHTYWYKYEVLKWKKVKTIDDDVIIICDNVIDSQPYCAVCSTSAFTHNGGNTPSDVYEFSDIRKWINNYFYEYAFSNNQKGLMNLSEVYVGNKFLYDNVFILSKDETLTYYPGLSTPSNENYDGAAISTGYAISQNNDIQYPNQNPMNYGEWWLRKDSNSGHSEANQFVSNNNDTGKPYIITVKSSVTSVGVRPAITLGDFVNKYVTLTTKNEDNSKGKIYERNNSLYLINDAVTVRAYPNSGYVFDGWYENDELVSTSKIYRFTMTRCITLTAKWREKPATDTKIYVTSFNDNPTAGNITEYTDKAFDENSTITLIAEPNEGYEFVGWYDGETQVSTDLEYTFTPDEDTVIIAKWKDLNDDGIYSLTTINSHPELGTITEYNNTEFVASACIKLVNSINEDINYDFVGWYEGDILLSKDLIYNHTMTKDIVITALWRLKTYTVTTSNNNSSAGSITTYNEEVFDINTEVTLTATVDETSGYTFSGWYNGTELVSSSEVYTFTIRNDVTLTAKWTYYTISTKPFFGNGSSNPAKKDYYVAGHFTTLEGQKVTVGTTITLEATLRDGSTWVGWYDATNDNLLSEEQTYEYEMTSQNVIIYAKYLLYKYLNKNKTTAQFGYYPQTQETDVRIIARLELIAQGWFEDYPMPTPGNSYLWTPYDYYYSNGELEEYAWYIDIDYDEDGFNDYRGVYFIKRRRPYLSQPADSSEDKTIGGKYFVKSDYWFKYEPITWVELDDSDNNKFMFASKILDATHFYHSIQQHDEYMEYGVSTYEPNDYSQSDIRYWLNYDFMNLAFDTERQKLINVTHIDNSLYSTQQDGNVYECDDTDDKLFLISRYEYYAWIHDYYQQTTPTDYAIINCMTVSVNEGYEEYANYWLRSSYTSLSDYGVGTQAQVDTDCIDNNDHYTVIVVRGVRPATRVNFPL